MLRAELEMFMPYEQRQQLEMLEQQERRVIRMALMDV
jgi:hypothetical protein